MREHLPQTRRAALWGCYRNHFGCILRLNMICLLLFLPMAVVLYLKESLLVNGYQSLEEATAAQINNLYIQLHGWLGLPEAGAFLLFILLFSGVVRVIRQLLWDEPFSFGGEFGIGLRRCAMGFLTAVLPAVVFWYVLKWAGTSLMTGILSVILLFAIIPVCIWILLQTVYYQLRYVESLRNSVILYIRTLPVTLLLTAATILPFWIVFSFAPLELAKYIILLVLVFVYITPVTMVWLLYASHIFDQYINKEHYPEIYRKGLR